MGKNVIPFPGAVEPGQPHSPGQSMEEFVHNSFGFDNSRDMDDAMAEYTEFCESLPEDKTVPSFMEFMGRRNMASESLGNVSDLLKNREFDSEEELNRFLQSHMDMQNNSPVEDFLGLSPRQMMEIQSEKFTGRSSLLTLETTRVSRYNVPLLDRVLRLLEKFALAGAIPATAKGNLGQKFVQQIFKDIYDIDGFGKYRKIRSEENLPRLVQDRFLLEETGCIIRKSRYFEITEKGMGLAGSGSPDEFFRELFLAYMTEFNWGYSSYIGGIEFYQTNGIFFLYLLHRKGEMTSSELCRLVNAAFPGWLEEQNPHADPDLMKRIFSSNIIYFICKLFYEGLGLAELEWIGEGEEECLIKPSKLFYSFLKWA